MSTRPLPRETPSPTPPTAPSATPSQPPTPPNTSPTAIPNPVGRGHSLNPPLEVPSLYQGAFLETLYKGFSEDLCHGYLIQDTDIALAEGAPPGVPNLYRRHSCGEDGYELLTTVAPSEPAPGFSKETEGESLYFPTVQGFNADGTVATFKAPAKLTPQGSEEDVYQAYLHRDGELDLLSVLPDGEAVDTHASIGTALGDAGKRFFDSVDSAVSADGSRVFWSAEIKEPPTPVHVQGEAQLASL